MGMEVKRQVQLTGGSSFTVTLPKNWAKQQGVREGTTLVMRVMEDGGLAIYPEGREPKREFKEITIKTGPHVDRDVVGSYLYGYDLIRILSFRGFTEEEISSIKRSVRRLAGAEIVEEKPNVIEVQVMLDPEAVTPEKVLRRQYALVQGMVDDVTGAVLKNDISLGRAVIQRDEEVDRHYFTLVRVIRSAVRDPDISRRLNLTPLNLLDIRVAAKFLEDSGDQAASIARGLSTYETGGIGEGIMQQFSELAGIIVRMGSKPIDALLDEKPELTLDTLSLRTEFIKKGEAFKQLLLQAPAKQQVVLMHYYACLDRICENLADISELGSPIIAQHKST
ncbi:MAG TPA: phosphate uptake regulator PhoU [Candidatus Caldiarchaeum subterraneum]|uniref:Phosphate uptake regulator PhoU n=1 Tax=Caldiarchaeum subterraneum TaxID=311458 RepID=A0A832ZUJ9_CALS0|nr:phosphate uptake regulator PhoU [Candidatus Caldarchaeum subterraneum]